jgi:hypothetical protein
MVVKEFSSSLRTVLRRTEARGLPGSELVDATGVVVFDRLLNQRAGMRLIERGGGRPVMSHSPLLRAGFYKADPWIRSIR